MPDLYILGAGCSRNYSQATHRIRGLKSPLNRDFFKMASLVIENTGMKADSLFMGEIHALIRKIAPLYGRNDAGLDFFDSTELSLEDVMTMLDIDNRLFSPNADQKMRSTESRELRAIKELLVRTMDYALMGSPCSKHNALAQRMKAGDVVISFNYDILIDNALFNLGKMTDSGYKVNFFKVNQDGQWMRLDEKLSEITLLKLHGSLNWVRCGLCGSLFLYRFRKQTLIGAQEFQCPRCSSGEIYAKRMIIPPIQSKDYGDSDILFLWIQTDRIMRDFSRIICIGYSFASTDFDMVALMRRFRAKQARIPEVHLVDPDPYHKVEKRLRFLLGVKTRQYDDLSSYLRST